MQIILVDTRRQQPIRMASGCSTDGLETTGGGLLGYETGLIKGAPGSWKYEFLIVG